MTSRWLLAGLILWLSTGCVQQAPFTAVQDAVGQVTHADGFPSVTRNARPYILDEASRLFTTDLIRTDNQSRLTIEFTGGQVVHLDPNTQLLISSVEQRPGEHRYRFSLTSGSLMIEGHDAVPDRLTIRSSIAQVTTDSGSIWMGYDRNSPTLRIISLNNASIIVSNDDGKVELTTAGQTTTVSPGSAPGAITTWSPERITRTISYYEQIQ
ncbi:MAG: FecR domain-containing protein [Pseudomonadales bacterium]|nr:FecR domain-containing protein [Pseudomonadales bacterium]MBO6657488.1 FecR domain-containing protein [Pseudomonadales bacterium]MBO6700835.1 FecR domain-containing protein [Pseudomonadales bacterium]MBO7004845.1 FecR domain-containing protein [Pseudomonadales bacterium]